MRPDLRQAFVLRVALAQIATLPSVVAGIIVLVGGLEGLYWLVAGMVLSTLVALFEAWVLLVRDEPVGEASSFSPPYAPQCVEVELFAAQLPRYCVGPVQHP